MPEDRITSSINIGYSATNGAGVETLAIELKMKVADQSPQSASKHLLAIVSGVAAPAQAQAEGL